MEKKYLLIAANIVMMLVLAFGYDYLYDYNYHIIILNLIISTVSFFYKDMKSNPRAFFLEVAFNIVILIASGAWFYSWMDFGYFMYVSHTAFLINSFFRPPSIKNLLMSIAIPTLVLILAMLLFGVLFSFT